MTDNKKRLAPTLNEQTPSELQIFSFSENKTTIRNLMINDVPHFVATDVALALGYANPRDAIRQHCKGVVKYDILTNGGKQSMNVIPEGDVYRLIINSHLPSAQKFERWLMEEVLHHALMQSCVANLKNQSISDLQVQDYVKENNYWTLELLENLIPSVDELQKINQESHGK